MNLRLCHASLLVVSALAAGVGCGRSDRLDLMRQAASTTKETADLLATVHDQATAEAARPQLKVLAQRLHSVSEALERYQDRDDEFPSRAEEKIGAAWIAQQSRLMQQEYRVGQIPAARTALGEPWQQLTGGTFDPGGMFAPGGEMDLQAPHPARLQAPRPAR
jgi:hypothetical protein